MAIVNRRTFIAGRGHAQEVVDMLKGEGETSRDMPYRIYRSHYGPFDQVVLEIEFEDVAAMESMWADWNASDRGMEYMRRWVEITEPGGSNEVWILEEKGG